MKALTLHQPWASLIAVGAKHVETRSWRTDYRGPLAIHAGKHRPEPGEEVGGWWWDEDQGEQRGVLTSLTEPFHDAPLGAVVATCRLADVVPIVVEWPTAGSGPCVYGGGRYSLTLWRTGANVAGEKIEDERPFGDYREGRFAWLLEDVKPTTERCPACAFDPSRQPGYITVSMLPQDAPVEALDAGTSNVVRTCGVCDAEGRCEPVPARGRQGLWTWEP